MPAQIFRHDFNNWHVLLRSWSPFVASSFPFYFSHCMSPIRQKLDLFIGCELWRQILVVTVQRYYWNHGSERNLFDPLQRLGMCRMECCSIVGFEFSFKERPWGWFDRGISQRVQHRGVVYVLDLFSNCGFTGDCACIIWFGSLAGHGNCDASQFEDRGFGCHCIFPASTKWVSNACPRIRCSWRYQLSNK